MTSLSGVIEPEKKAQREKPLRRSHLIMNPEV
jgi:hypothetical protein